MSSEQSWGDFYFSKFLSMYYIYWLMNKLINLPLQVDKLCSRFYFQEEYERYILAATTDHGVIQEAEVTLSTDLSPTDQENLAEVVGDRDYHSEPEPNQSSEPANSFAKDGTVSTVSSKQSQEIGLYESSAMFWMKFIATQLLILNFLVFLLVVIAISV